MQSLVSLLWWRTEFRTLRRVITTITIIIISNNKLNESSSRKAEIQIVLLALEAKARETNHFPLQGGANYRMTSHCFREQITYLEREILSLLIQLESWIFFSLLASSGNRKRLSTTNTKRANSCDENSSRRSLRLECDGSISNCCCCSSCHFCPPV